MIIIILHHYDYQSVKLGSTQQGSGAPTPRWRRPERQSWSPGGFWRKKLLMFSLTIIITIIITIIVMACRHIPTMTKSHHGGKMSVIIKVGMCQCQNLTIPDKVQLGPVGSGKLFNMPPVLRHNISAQLGPSDRTQ